MEFISGDKIYQGPLGVVMVACSGPNIPARLKDSLSLAVHPKRPLLTCPGCYPRHLIPAIIDSLSTARLSVNWIPCPDTGMGKRYSITKEQSPAEVPDILGLNHLGSLHSNKFPYLPTANYQ